MWFLWIQKLSPNGSTLLIRDTLMVLPHLTGGCTILRHCLGQRIWGRGSNDDKSGLVGVMSSIESLLENGFKPTRTVVLSFGFDEEANGIYVRTSYLYNLYLFDWTIYSPGCIDTGQVLAVNVRERCIRIPYRRGLCVFSLFTAI